MGMEGDSISSFLHTPCATPPSFRPSFLFATAHTRIRTHMHVRAHLYPRTLLTLHWAGGHTAHVALRHCLHALHAWHCTGHTCCHAFSPAVPPLPHLSFFSCLLCCHVFSYSRLSLSLSHLGVADLLSSLALIGQGRHGRAGTRWRQARWSLSLPPTYSTNLKEDDKNGTTRTTRRFPRPLHTHTHTHCTSRTAHYLAHLSSRLQRDAALLLPLSLFHCAPIIYLHLDLFPFSFCLHAFCLTCTRTLSLSLLTASLFISSQSLFSLHTCLNPSHTLHFLLCL